MSEPLEERLSRFTPDATGLNRDALLFSAGRASMHPSRHWQALVGVLAASQLLTFVCLWPRAPLSPPHETPFVASESFRPNRTPMPAPKPDPSELRVLRQRMQDGDLDYPTPPSNEPMGPQGPPLRGFGTPPADLLN
jgi:hypothetical protein